jgi:hypothetical protein
MDEGHDIDGDGDYSYSQLIAYYEQTRWDYYVYL